MSKKTTSAKRERIVTTQSSKSLLGGLTFTTEHSGKMTGIHSLSTSCVVNNLCLARMKDPSNICHECYAYAMMTGIYQHSMPDTFAENTRILTESILSDDVLPLWPTRDGRFEAFGDLNNWIQAVNYFNIAKKNPSTHFALWTKNPWIIQETIDKGYAIPKNLEIVLSSLKLNEQASPEGYDFIDKVFTVYSKPYLEQHPEVVINCGARSCLACERCYKKNPKGIKVQFINEVLKKR